MINRVQWDTTVIALLVALALVIGAAVVYILYKTRQRRDETAHQQMLAMEERLRKASWASAVVIASNSMAARVSSSDKVRVTLELNVVPPEGEPYPVKTTWGVDPDYLKMLRPGETVLVKIDPFDGMRVYPNESWAQLLEWNSEERTMKT